MGRLQKVQNTETGVHVIGEQHLKEPRRLHHCTQQTTTAAGMITQHGDIPSLHSPSLGYHQPTPRGPQHTLGKLPFVFHTKKHSDETQRLCAGCSKVEPKISPPPQTPFPGARDGQNLISWRWSLPLPANPVWWGSMHTISSYHGNRPTNKQTHGVITIHCTTASLACSVMSK